MLLGNAVAVCRVPPADCDALQRAAVSSDALAKRGKRRTGGSLGMGAPLRPTGAGYGRLARATVRSFFGTNAKVDFAGPVRIWPRTCGGRNGRAGRAR